MVAERKSAGWMPVLYMVIGAVLTLAGTVVSELYLMPAKDHRIQVAKQKEDKVTKLYQPLLFATGYGNLSMRSAGVFYEVHDIMKRYGHLADQEVIEKYIEFLKQCKFGGYSELKQGDIFSGPVSDIIIVELIKQGKPPMQWTADRLERALAIEKEFYPILERHYIKAREDYLQ